MPGEEYVAVVRRDLLDSLGALRPITQDVDRYLQLLDQHYTVAFLPRSQVEHNPSYKQLIPYVITVNDQGEVLTYVRGKRGNEPRLADLRSIGIGGHINTGDIQKLCPRFATTYEAGVLREIREEIGIRPTRCPPIVAIIGDDSTPVNRVHLGIVHLLRLEPGDIISCESGMQQVKFASLDEIHKQRDTMELWSRLCLDALPEVIDWRKTSGVDVSAWVAPDGSDKE